MENQIFELQYAIDTFYFLVCGALVMWMAPGFAMLEAGLVRSKNTTEILTKNVSLFAISCTMYLACGYQFMYGGGFFLGGLAGGETLVAEALATSSQNGFHGDSVYAKAADFFFQSVFVATCMSIVSGAVAERMKLWAFLAFTVVMAGIIYPIEGSWVWGGQPVFGLFSLTEITDTAGNILYKNLGFSDFAGGGVVHLAGAAAALAGVLLLGSRKGKYSKSGKPRAILGANLPLATLGTFILWFGWFGFNGGSVLKLGDMANASSVAAVLVNSNAAAAGGAIGALTVAWFIFRKADLTMLLNGALAGLVVITPGAAAPTPLLSVIFGVIAGMTVVWSILFIDRKLKLDDPVGAISVHGVVGLLGLLIVPISNPEATFLGQLGGALVIFVWVFSTSLAVWAVIKYTMGIRISEEGEYVGADVHECGQEAYPEFVN